VAPVDVFAHLTNGFATALSPANLVLAALGVTLGTAVGVLPGIGPAMTVALLLPLTYHFDPTGAFILFAGIYYGSMYGGSTTAILLNAPGESASLVTAIEGHAMAKSGRGGAALATAVIGSFVAGTLGTLMLSFLAPVAARLALLLQPADYFALILLALASVTCLVGKSLLLGMLSLFAGLLLGLVGIDPLSGQLRLTFGVTALLDGLDVVVVAVGLFAVGEVLHQAGRRGDDDIVPLKGSVWMTALEWRRSWGAWLRGTLLGFPFGVLPVGGGEIPTFLSYGLEKRLSKHPEEFEKGAIEGVAGPEAANNAACTGVLAPLLTLGLPTSATAAVLLVAFQNYNLQPGPLLFQKNAALVWALIASMYVGNMMLLVLNLPLVRLWIKLLELPRPVLHAGILVFATLGVYAKSNSVTDVLVMYALGVVGFLMRRCNVPTGPLLLGVILMPQAEAQLRRAMQISQGDASVFLTRPLPIVVLSLFAIAMLIPWALRFAKARSPRS
jgi:putative tricarboxylic transport membrane protein